MKCMAGKRIHCIGIGGAGMAPLAELLAARGAEVTGSDRQDSPAAAALREQGIGVQLGHEPRLIPDAHMVIYSSAVREQNPERQYAARKGIVQYRRAEVLGELMRHVFSIGIAGTHGKTTTTAMLGHILENAGLEPTVLVGGRLPNRQSNALIGTANLLVTEADEYDRSFLSMYPAMAILTNVEADHLDCYGSYDRIKDAFADFCSRIPFYGCLVACVDDPGVREVLARISTSVVTVATNGAADYRGYRQSAHKQTNTFVVEGPEGRCGEIRLPLWGEHNLRNALSATVAALRMGVSFEAITEALRTFGGVNRRMEVVGEARGVVVIDDYAHHPTEVRATLGAVREMGRGKVVTIFQPHLYSRTRDFLAVFAESLSASDVVVVVDIYAAREEPLDGVSSTAIVEQMRRKGHVAAYHAPDGASAAERVAPLVRAGDVVVLMGAGDIGQSAQGLLERIYRD